MSKLFCVSPGLRVLERQMQQPPGYRPRGYGICVMDVDWRSRGNYSEIVEALIRQYDRPNAFFYCDPPYFETEGHYEVVFRKEDHVRLRDTLAGIEGKFMVSYNDCEYIRELYQDFQIEAVTRINNLAQRYDNGSEFPEVLIANYDMEERRKSLPMQMNLFEMFDEQKASVWHGSSRKEDEDGSVSGDNGSAE